MSRRATHQGHCQVCTRLCKLPGGFIAKHGYNVTYGFFNGTCWGSDELPYEQSCDLVKESVERAKEEVESLLVEQQNIENLTGDYANQVKIKERLKGWIAQTVWTKCTIEQRNGYWVPLNSKGESVRTYSPVFDVLSFEEALRKFNENYLYYLTHTAITQYNGYIKIQEERVAQWSEQPLLPLQSVKETSNV